MNRLLLSALFLAGAAQAAPVPATDPAQAPVPQTGAKADAIRETLKRIKLPPGFSIELHAVVPDARHIAVAGDGEQYFVGTRRSTLWAVRGGEVRAFVPSMTLKIPNGPCFAPDGALILVEQNRITRFAKAASWRHGEPVDVSDVVPQGQLIPVDEEHNNHSQRVCRVGPDGLLYVSLGQKYNVQPRDKLKLYERLGIGGIVRMNAVDGSKREVYAAGIRNSVGHDFNPKDGTLWFTDNQTDGMGDDIPAGEINRITKPGQFFGYPWTNAGTRITEHGYDKDPLPANIVEPEVKTQAHAADLGMVFYTGKSFPAKYQGGIFSAQHGSWNRSVPVGAQLIFTSLKADGTADKTEVFATGWMNTDGTYAGRPVDVAQLKDGSLLISDDRAGAIYRVSYKAP